MISTDTVDQSGCRRAERHRHPSAWGRRGLLKFGAMGAAGLLAAAGPPWGDALAAGGTEALLLNCIDYRLTAATTRYMTGHGMAGKYDQLSLAGASLGAENDKFPAWAATFWDHVQLAIELHHIRRVVVMDHRDCGAYRVLLGKDLAADPREEFAVHAAQMRALRAAIAEKHPQLAVELLLMALDGRAEPVA
jgi:Putative carbonic anhydrase